MVRKTNTKATKKAATRNKSKAAAKATKKAASGKRATQAVDSKVGAKRKAKAAGQAARSLSFENWMREVADMHAEGFVENALAPAAGACLVTNPKTNEAVCILTTSTACKAFKGTFLGGPCGE